MLFRNPNIIIPSCRQSSWPSVQSSFPLYITEVYLETSDTRNGMPALWLLSRSINFATNVPGAPSMQMFPSLISRCATLNLSCSSVIQTCGHDHGLPQVIVGNTKKGMGSSSFATPRTFFTDSGKTLLYLLGRPNSCISLTVSASFRQYL